MEIDERMFNKLFQIDQQWRSLSLMRPNVKYFVVAVIATANSVGCTNENTDREVLQTVWNDASSTLNLYLLEPPEFDVLSSEFVQPSVVVHSDNITPALVSVLRDVTVLPRGDGPFPECTPEPGQENFYLIVEEGDAVLRRFAEASGCGNLGYGFPGQSGFFQQPIEGLISTEQFCEVAENVGISPFTCI